MVQLNHTEFAKRHGFSRQYVGQLVKAGILTTENGLIETDVADEIIEKRQASAPNNRSSRGIGSEQQNRLFEAKLRAAEHKANILATKEKALMGEYISREATMKRIWDSERTVRDNILNVPDRISHQLVNVPDPAVIYRIIDDELRLALTSTANILTDLYPDG